MRKIEILTIAGLMIMAAGVARGQTFVQDYEDPGLDSSLFDTDFASFVQRPSRSGSTLGIVDLGNLDEMALVPYGNGVTPQAMNLEIVDLNPTTANIFNPPEGEVLDGWTVRWIVNSSASPGALNPNIATTGFVGFIMAVDQAFADANLQVGYVVDDPTTGDVGVLQNVVADGAFHLYEWDLTDDNDWTTFDAVFGSTGLGNGMIDGANVTTDSIAILAGADASVSVTIDQIGFDTAGSLAGLETGATAPLRGDFDFDGDQDATDIDAIYAEVLNNAVQDQPRFELDGDLGLDPNNPTRTLTGGANITQGDVDELVLNVLGTNYGDLDLDGNVDAADEATLLANKDQPGPFGWADGDVDGDTDVDDDDLAILQANLGGAPLLGDANKDGQVTGADLISVQQNFGNVGATPLQGDANNDGQVTGADLISVQQNFGNVAAPSAGAVPEPASAALMALGALAVLYRRKPRRPGR